MTVKLNPLQVNQLKWREKILKAALQLVPADDVRIVETGTIRMRPGFSTLFFARMIRDVWKGKGNLVSIDMNRVHISLSIDILRENDLEQFVEWKLGDSKEWITQRKESIDFLYLDSAWYPPVILGEFQAAEQHMHKHTIVAVDDCENEPRYGPQGKGTDVIPYAESKGWRVRVINGPKKRMAVMRKEEVC